MVNPKRNTGKKGKQNPKQKKTPSQPTNKKVYTITTQSGVKVAQRPRPAPRSKVSESQLMKESKAYLRRMLLADRGFQMPRLIPTATVPGHNFGKVPIDVYQTPDLAKGQTDAVILRCSPNIVNPIQRFVQTSVDSTVSGNIENKFDSHFYSSQDDQIFMDVGIPLSTGHTIKASPLVATNGWHWSSSSNGLRQGGRYWPMKFSFGNNTGNGVGTFTNPDSAVMNVTVTLGIAIKDGDDIVPGVSASTTDNYTGSNTASAIGGSSSWQYNGATLQSWSTAAAYLNQEMSLLGDSAVGLFVKFSINNSSTIGNVPSGLKIDIAPGVIPQVLGYGYWTPFAWAVESNIQNAISEMLQSDQFSYTGMAVLLQNQTPEAFQGGNIVVAQVPADDEWRLPTTPYELERYLLGSQLANKYDGLAKDGGHWSMKFMTVQELQWKNSHPRASVDEPLSYPVAYFILRPSFTSQDGNSKCSFYLHTNLAYELITTTQTRDMIPPMYDRFGLVAAFVAALSEVNTCGCNPDHLTKIANAVKHVINDPRVRSVMATMAKAGVTSLLAAL